MKIKKFDIIIIVLLLFFALLSYGVFYFFGSLNSDVFAEIMINGTSKKIVSLNEDKIFSLENLPNVQFEIKDKKIRFLKSDCPDKVCVNTGFIGTAGQTAVCLPNAVSIKIIPKSENNNTVDVVI